MFLGLQVSEISAEFLPESLDRLAEIVAHKHQLVAQIPETAVCDIPYFRQFIQGLRERDIEIAYANFCGGPTQISNWQAVAPDYLKLSPSLVKGISRASGGWRTVQSLIQVDARPRLRRGRGGDRGRRRCQVPRGARVPVWPGKLLRQTAADYRVHESRRGALISTVSATMSSKKVDLAVPLQAITATEPIPGYRIRERIGAGGYGEVWKADAPGGLVKAIKFVYGFLTEDRASRELKALNRIKSVRHPFLLSLGTD